MNAAKDVGVMLGAAAVAAALLLLGTALVGAVASTPAQAPEAPEASAREPAEGPEDTEDTEDTRERRPETRWVGGEASSSELLRLAVRGAPFDPERRAPSARYRLPEERVEAPEPEPPAELPPPPDFRVLGTVAGPDGGVVVVQVEDEPPRVLAAGEQISGYTVRAVEGASVVLSGPGQEVSLAVADAPAMVAAQPQRSSRQERQGNSRQQRERAEQERRLELQVREMAEALARRMQQEVGGVVRLQMQGDRAILTGPAGERREVRIDAGAGTVTIRDHVAPAPPGR